MGAWLTKAPMLNDPNYARTFLSQFNMVTISQFQWDIIQPTQGKYDFSTTDALVNFARKNNLKIRGYALISAANLPAWIQNGNFNEKQARAILKNYIVTVVRRYRGKIDSWVVVNQAMADNGNLQNSYWLKTIGPEYINLAFQWANQADPKAHLYYAENDWGLFDLKSTAVLKLMTNLKDKKIPVDGIGLQFNVALDTIPTQTQIEATMRQYARLNLDLQISEAAVRLSKPVTAEKLARQAERYQRLMNACLAVNRCKAFMLWGFTDAYPISGNLYPNQGSAFLFDENYQPKPAYFGIYRALTTP